MEINEAIISGLAIGHKMSRTSMITNSIEVATRLVAGVYSKLHVSHDSAKNTRSWACFGRERVIRVV